MRFVWRFIDTASPSSGDGPTSRLRGQTVLLAFGTSGCRPSGVAAQGTRDSNPQPPVLETGALPIELVPSGRGRAGRARIAAPSGTPRGGRLPPGPTPRKRRTRAPGGPPP